MPDKQPSPLFTSLNPRKEPLTPDKFRELSGNPDLNDEEAAIIIQSINKLAAIFLGLSHKESTYCIDNQLYVSLNSDTPPNVLEIPINPFTQPKAA